MGRATGGLGDSIPGWRAAAPWRVRELFDDLLEHIKTGILKLSTTGSRICSFKSGSCCIALTGAE